MQKRQKLALLGLVTMILAVSLSARAAEPIQVPFLSIGALAGHIDSWRGAAHVATPDGKAQVMLAADEKNLYVAVDVDDNVIACPDDMSADFRGSDSVRIYLDTRGDGPALNHRGMMGDDVELVIVPRGPFGKSIATVLFGRGPVTVPLNPRQVKTSVAARKGGYFVETAFPLSDLQVKRGTDFGINVAVNDVGGPGQPVLSWLQCVNGAGDAPTVYQRIRLN